MSERPAPGGSRPARYDRNLAAPVQTAEAPAALAGDIDLKDLLGQVRSRLNAHYGSRLDSVILHGSVARRTAEPESDIDLLVLLRGDFDYFRELRILVDLLYPLQLEAERILSVLPASADDYRNGTLQLYRNAALEGIAL